jgi:hypothetical protein
MLTVCQGNWCASGQYLLPELEHQYLLPELEQNVAGQQFKKVCHMERDVTVNSQ